jgi:hypothetical protein
MQRHGEASFSGCIMLPWRVAARRISSSSVAVLLRSLASGGAAEFSALGSVTADSLNHVSPIRRMI